MNVFETLAGSAHEARRRAAFIEEGAPLEYGAFWEAVESARRRLGAQGLGAGCAVGVMGQNGSAFVVAALAALGSARGGPAAWVWALMAGVAVAGAVGPTWQYLTVRPVVEEALRRPVGIGAGVWLNALGCLLVAGVCLGQMRAAQNKNRQPSG